MLECRGARRLSTEREGGGGSGRIKFDVHEVMKLSVTKITHTRKVCGHLSSSSA